MTYQLNKIKTKDGVTYNTLHWWLRRKYGSANKCEHPSCDKTSPYFQWSLKKGMEYFKDVDNFWQLCRKCHFKYDLKEYQKLKFNEGRLLAPQKRIGSKHTDETRKKIKEALLKKFPNGRTAWNKGIPWDKETKEKMAIAKIGHTPWNKGIKIV